VVSGLLNTTRIGVNYAQRRKLRTTGPGHVGVAVAGGGAFPQIGADPVQDGK